jgi:transglutaminase-like putative cysteine protease
MESRSAAAPRVIDRFFEFSLLGMLAAGYFAVVGSGYLDWPTAALTLMGLCLRGLMAAGVVELEFSNRLVALVTLGYILFYPLDYLFISGAFLQATVHLVCFLAVLKILTAKTNRDYTYVKMIAVLELLAAAVLSISLSFFAYLALFLLLAIAAFSSGEIRRSAQLRRAVVRGGLTAFPRRLAALTVFLFSGILILTAGMFFVLPRTARAALDRFVPQKYHLPGFTNGITLGQIGEIKHSSAPVMHIKTWPEGEGLLDVKWRGAALSRFDGMRWDNPPGRADIELPIEHGVLMVNRNYYRAPTRPGRTLVYTVHLNDIASDTLFIAGTPQTISINVPFVELTRAGSFTVPELGGRGAGLTYGVYSFLEDESAAVRATPEPLSPRMRADLLQLPAIDPRIAPLARKMTAGAREEAEKAERIEYHLRHDYGYTLELLPKTVPDPLANFLFDRKKGHCEYFASAMAVMLRTLGIPSRVVTGFQSGVYNPITHLQVVRASDAHSWVEAWINGHGWMTYDPTPPDPHAAVMGLMARMSLFFDAAEQFWQDWVVSYDLDRQIVLASRMDAGARRLSFHWFSRDWLDQAIRAAAPWAPAAGFGGALAILSFVFGREAVARWKRRMRVRRIARGEGEASDATLLYERMLGNLARRGFQKPPWLTPGEFARVLPPTEVRGLVHDLTAFYNEFRFGGRRDVAPRMMELLERLEKTR